MTILQTEEATLSITKEFEPADDDDSNLMYSIATYVAENSETLNLVEGERLYVIGNTNALYMVFLCYFSMHLVLIQKNTTRTGGS